MDGYEFEKYYLYAFVYNEVNSARLVAYMLDKKDGRQ